MKIGIICGKHLKKYLNTPFVKKKFQKNIK